jgi:hypothetical protein
VTAAAIAHHRVREIVILATVNDLPRWKAVATGHPTPLAPADDPEEVAVAYDAAEAAVRAGKAGREGHNPTRYTA